MDVDSERKVVGKLLEQLSDSSKDTQGLTVDLYVVQGGGMATRWSAGIT